MAPRDPNLQRVIDELANALQVAVLIAEHLELASSASAQDAIALSRNLKRATDAIQQFRVERGVE
jgi:phosphopantetheine adenylyltransferase